MKCITILWKLLVKKKQNKNVFHFKIKSLFNFALEVSVDLFSLI